jgi:hypothetical protein
MNSIASRDGHLEKISLNALGLLTQIVGAPPHYDIPITECHLT